MADAGIVGHRHQVLGALFDQAFDQRIGLADGAEAANEDRCAVLDAGQRVSD